MFPSFVDTETIIFLGFILADQTQSFFSQTVVIKAISLVQRDTLLSEVEIKMNSPF